MAGPTVSSKLDANCENYQKLTTFITPFGRNYFWQLTFGICSAPGHIQHSICAVLVGYDRVLCHLDDVLIFGRDHDEQDICLCATQHLIQEAGVTVNPKKCKFSRNSITFWATSLVSRAFQLTPAILTNMEKPKNITELRRFIAWQARYSIWGSFLLRLRNSLSHSRHSSATEQHGCGAQHRKRPLMQSN